MDADSETNDYRKVMGVVAIREEEIFISGAEIFMEYYSEDSGRVRSG